MFEMIRLLGALFFPLLFLANTSFAREVKDIKYAIKNATSIDSLDFSYRDIPNIDWKQFSNLKSLKLNYCQLQFLPKDIQELKALENLELDGNVFEDNIQTFETISRLQSLRNLSLNNCYLFFIPTSISNLKYLERLEVENNYLNEISWSIRKLRFLKELNASKNDLDTLQLDLIGLKQLEVLDLSYNKNIEEKIALQIISALPSMKELIIQGWDSIPMEISLLYQVEKLDVSHGSFVTLPKEISEMTQLKSIEVLSKAINWSLLMESLAACKALQNLTMGGCELKNFPFNAFKLKKLNNLIIKNSKIIRVPNSFSRVNVKSVIFENCVIEKAENLFTSMSGHKKLESLYFSDCMFEKANISLRNASKLQLIQFERCNIKKLLNLELNGLTPKIDVLYSATTSDQINQWSKSNPTCTINWSNPNTLSRKEKLKIPGLNIETPKNRATVYGEVGLVLDAGRSITIDIPANSFIDLQGNIIKDEVDVHYHIVDNSLEAIFSGLEMQTTTNGKDFQQIVPNLILQIKAFHDGEEININPDKEIVITFFNETENLQLFYYHPSDGLMAIDKSIDTDTSSCEQLGFELNDRLVAKWDEHPVMINELRKSRVYLRLKKATKKRNFYFYLEPEYGFNEKYIPLLGNKIKAYPEFRPYKKIRWNYVGAQQEDDFNSMYSLSDQSPKRIKKRSSFFLYVMSLNDIRLKPSDRGDFYEMTFYRGFDTLKLDVMPQLGITKPHRIQKWHRNKYVKYTSILKERNIKWHELDSIYEVRYTEFENNLNHYRKLVLMTSNIEKGKKQLTPQTFSINKNNYYMIGKFSTSENDSRNVTTISDLDGNSLKVDHLYSTTLIGDNLIQTEGNKLILQKEEFTLIWSNLSENKVAFAVINDDFDGSLRMSVLLTTGLKYAEITQILYQYVESYR